jgi:hypothetical protein
MWSSSPQEGASDVTDEDHGGAEIATPAPVRKISIHDEKEKHLKAVRLDGMRLFHLGLRSCSDKEVVMAAVTQNGRALPASHCTDEDIVIAAVTQTWQAYHHLPTSWQSLDIILDIMVKHGYSGVRLMADKIAECDRERTLSLVKINGDVLEFASAEFKSDFEIVLAAVTQSWKAVRHAALELNDNFKIMMVAVKQNGSALRYGGPLVRKKRDIVMTAIKGDGGSFAYADDSLRYDRQLVMAAVKQNGSMLRFACGPLKDDHEVVFAAISTNFRAFDEASREVRLSMKTYVRDLMKRYQIRPEVYRSAFILGIYNRNDDADQIPLHKLNHLGEEALVDFIKEVGDYAGVKAGPRWESMIAVGLNLMKAETASNIHIIPRFTF